jgi:hypothetical protein
MHDEPDDPLWPYVALPLVVLGAIVLAMAAGL